MIVDDKQERSDVSQRAHVNRAFANGQGKVHDGFMAIPIPLPAVPLSELPTMKALLQALQPKGLKKSTKKKPL